MTTPKRLSPEEVDTALELIDGEDRQRIVVGKATIRGHIAALEAEIDHAQAVNRADLRRHEQHISDLEMSLENARKERDEAVADNAALLDDLNDLRGTVALCAGHIRAGVNKYEVAAYLRSVLDKTQPRPHPGAALLEEYRKEITRWQENVETVKGERDTERRMRLEQGEALAACQQHIRETGEEHRKALVRARNEGLEEAARKADTHGGLSLAWRIRAMMEPEPV